MRRKTEMGWTEDDVRWQIAMARYAPNDLYDHLERALTARAGEARHLCEIGCGVGSLTLRLARSVPKITAVDKNERPMLALFQSLLEGRIRNVNTVQMDFRRLTFEADAPDVTLLHADCLAFSELEYISKKSARLIVLLETSEAWPPCPGEASPGKARLNELLMRLAARRAQPECAAVGGRADQPVASRQDALAYCAQCAPKKSRRLLRGFVEANLLEAEGEEHGFVLPRKREYTLMDFHS